METKMTTVNIKKNLYDLAKLHKINITSTLNEALEKKLENYETLQVTKAKLEEQLKLVNTNIELRKTSIELASLVKQLTELKDLEKAKALASPYASKFGVSVRELCTMAGYK